MKFSISLLCSGIFIAYILNAIYSLVQLYMPPSCGDGQQCLKSFLATKPKLQLTLCTTLQSDLSNLNQLQLVDQWTPLDYSKNEPIVKNISISIPKRTRDNGTLFMYAFLSELPRHGSHGASASENWKQNIQKPTTMTALFQLTQYMVPEAKSFNLLRSDEDDKSKEDSMDKRGKGSKEKPVTHITKRLRLGLMTELHVLPRKDLPVEVAYMIRLLNSDSYLPPLKFDKFSNRLRDFYRLNSTDKKYDLELEFAPASIGNLRMAAQFELAMETMSSQFGFSEKDLDEIKGIFSDTNVYLLGVTMFVASIHLLFDFLAFKNDVIYWKRRKTIAGLSSRTILWRCFSQIVVFLYLLEEKSSLLVIVPSGIGAVIEIWKVKKAFKVSLGFSGVLPRVSFGAETDSEKATAKHDVESMKYLSFVLYPLCIGGAIYSLLYTPHKSWYSWTIQSMVNGVYAFGFLFMLPQLFVNYKLKSVAQLPWRAFMYKAFNTFIDDLFAFIITMPTSHRVACFRDDIVFLIYLYQRWLYPVDQSRLDAGGEFELETPASTEPAFEEKKTK